jgi:hypothetical protein
MEGEPIGPAFQYRIGAVAVDSADFMSGGYVERCEMVAIAWVGKRVDVGFPSSGGHRDLEMIEGGSAADDRLTA